MTTNYAHETSPLADSGIAHTDYSGAETLDLADPRLVKVTRLRLLSDPGYPVWDLSYCYGVDVDGKPVRVQLPRYQFPKRNLSRALVDMAREAGRYAKGMGLLDAVSTLN